MSDHDAGDQIHVLGIERVASHGVYSEEREEGRLFRVDVIATLRAGLRAFTSDRLGDTVNYEHIASVVDGVLGGPPAHLVEHLAEEVAKRCLRLEGVTRVQVTIHKRATGVAGSPKWVGVRIHRTSQRGVMS